VERVKNRPEKKINGKRGRRGESPLYGTKEALHSGWAERKSENQVKEEGKELAKKRQKGGEFPEGFTRGGKEGGFTWGATITTSAKRGWAP